MNYSNGIKYLIDILNKVGRKFHVLLNGIGHAKAIEAIKLFVNAGYTCSVLTSDPIFLGRNGIALLRQDDTNLFIEKQPDLSFDTLALNNVGTLTEILNQVFPNDYRQP